MTAKKTLKPLKPHGHFSRVTALSRGRIRHDIREYNRLHAIVSLLQSKNNAESEDIEVCMNPCFPYDSTRSW